MSERRFASLTLVPGAAWLVLLFLVPLGVTLAISFGVTDELGNALYAWHPENYSEVFDPLFLPILLRSVGYAFATVSLCLLIGYPIAYYIARFGGRHKYLLVALVVLPFLVNYLIRVYAWTAILSDDGLVNGVLKDIGVTDQRRSLPEHALRGDRRPRLRLHGVHDPARLRRPGPDGPVADRGRQGPLRQPLADLPPRHLARHLPGRARRLRCSSSCPPSVTSSPRSCSAAPTPTWSAT